MTSLAVVERNVVALQELITKDVSLIQSILRLAVNANLAELVSGTVYISENGVRGVITLGILQEPLGIVVWDIGCRIEV